MVPTIFLVLNPIVTYERYIEARKMTFKDEGVHALLISLGEEVRTTKTLSATHLHDPTCCTLSEWDISIMIHAAELIPDKNYKPSALP